MSVVLFSLFFSCKTRQSDNWETIKKKNNYYIIEQYLINHPNSDNLKEALNLIFKLKEEEDKKRIDFPTYTNYFGRNILRVTLNSENKLRIFSEIFNGKTDFKNLRIISKNFLSDSQIDFNHPENKYYKKLFKDIVVPISKGQFLFLVDKSADTDSIKKAIIILRNSINEYKQHIKKIVPQKHSLNKNLYDSIFDNKLSFFDLKRYEIDFKKQYINQ